MRLGSDAICTAVLVMQPFFFSPLTAVWDLVDLSYTMECEPEEWEALQLERYINQERNPELREALEDIDEFLFE
ncbi:hypothetical protein SAMN04487928_101236 [Butyrivibrio proteoclasticus]|uniref:Uncharacterized protein n=2 Tax=Butyrivibrio proteoclasticus TaxID=43305 RepID=A0A1I5Q0D5_9FIRM|nr:hypothetical protein SAMN04487928_101236 [Butyrivibrio proteoclasticus]